MHINTSLVHIRVCGTPFVLSSRRPPIGENSGESRKGSLYREIKRNKNTKRIVACMYIKLKEEKTVGFYKFYCMNILIFII